MLLLACCCGYGRSSYGLLLSSKQSASSRRAISWANLVSGAIILGFGLTHVLPGERAYQGEETDVDNGWREWEQEDPPDNRPGFPDTAVNHYPWDVS